MIKPGLMSLCMVIVVILGKWLCRVPVPADYSLSVILGLTQKACVSMSGWLLSAADAATRDREVPETAVSARAKKRSRKERKACFCSGLRIVLKA